MSLGWPGKASASSKFSDHLTCGKGDYILYLTNVYYHKGLINLEEVCLDSTVLEATLGHDSGREETRSFWFQRDIRGRRLQYAGKQNILSLCITHAQECISLIK